MDWFLLALLGPLLFAATNHIDKLLLEKYFKEGGVATLLLFSSLLSVAALPLLYWLEPTALAVAAEHIAALAVVGVLNALVLFCYFVALSDDEPSVTIVFYQLVPVFGYALGYLVLGETLTEQQLVGMGVIMLGTTMVSFELRSARGIRLRRKTVAYMLLASFLWALESVIFKYVALEENVWRSLFWSHAMLALIGACLFILSSTYRHHFVRAIATNSRAILTLNFANETLFMLGTAAVSVALLRAPIAIVLLGNSFQSLFVLILGVVLTLLYPHLVAERMQPAQLAQKLAAVAVTAAGTFILLR